MPRTTFNHKDQFMDEFFQRAVDFGWLNPEQAKMHKKAENSVEKKPSEYKKNIESLYGIKLDLNDQDSDPIDQAHPDGPHQVLHTYDLINGMVPNAKQKQEIDIDLSTNMPRGMHLNRRYIKAHQDLVKDLVAIGFMADGENKDQIRILADECLEQITKNAFLPLPWLIGGALVGGLTYMGIINNSKYTNQGIINNATRAITEIEEAKENVPSLAGDLIKLQGALNYLIGLGNQVATTVNAPSNTMKDATSFMDDLTSGKLVGIDVAEKAKGIAEFMDSGAGKEKLELLKKYKFACSKLSQYLPTYISSLKTSGMVAKQDSSNRWWAPISKAIEYVWPPAVEDAWKALETLQTSLIEFVNGIDSHARSVKELIDANKHDLIKEMGGELPKEDLNLQEKENKTNGS